MGMAILTNLCASEVYPPHDSDLNPHWPHPLLLTACRSPYRRLHLVSPTHLGS